ncbi:MAG: bis(5'-nucleosyl)-tetraphosphatase (symmetrical) YqeK [Anaerovoracaceae bacterium]
MYEKQKKFIEEYIENNFSEKRRKHIYNVREMAMDLAKIHGYDIKKAEIAALYHDMYKLNNPDKINNLVYKYNLGDEYLDNIDLAHSKVAAAVMENEYGINDEDIINAVKFHTTGRAGMSPLEMIIYVADKAEKDRIYPATDRIREALRKDLYRGSLLCFTDAVRYLQDEKVNKKIHKDTLEALDWLNQNNG